jgi:sugar lactone lactonase YvrE
MDVSGSAEQFTDPCTFHGEGPFWDAANCAFGGPNLQTLYITTSRQGIDPAAEQNAGAVFRFDSGVRGAPQHAFAG